MNNQAPDCPADTIEARCSNCEHVQALTQLSLTAFEGRESCRQYASFEWTPTAIEEVTTLRADNEHLQARVEELENKLAFADAFMRSDLKNEAWADTKKVKEARALLEGLGPLVDSLSNLRDAAASVSDGDWQIDDSIKGVTTKSGLCDIAFNLARWDQEFMVSAFNNLPDLITALRELGQTLGVRQ